MSLREILEDSHRDHEISPEERAALQVVRRYLTERLVDAPVLRRDRHA
jgi:hypothetical protein